MAATAPAEPRTLGEFLALPWRALGRLPPLSWLRPEPPVRVWRADGSSAVWLGTRVLASSTRTRFHAAELARDEVLEHRVALPPLADDAAHAALALEAQSISPFEASEHTWGWRQQPGDAHAVVAIARRADALAARERVPEAQRAQAEVWAFDAAGQPIVLQGFGEATRLHAMRRQRVWALLLLVSALLLAAAIALTPTLRLRLLATQAAGVLAQTERAAAPLLAQRERLTKALERREGLRAAMQDHVFPLGVLDALTRVLPDDTWVYRLQLKGDRLTLQGHTPNTAALLNRLGSSELLRDVKSPSPSTRVQGGGENFVIEATLADALKRSEVPTPAAVAASAPRDHAGSGAPNVGGGVSPSARPTVPTPATPSAGATPPAGAQPAVAPAPAAAPPPAPAHAPAPAPAPRPAPEPPRPRDPNNPFSVGGSR